MESETCILNFNEEPHRVWTDAQVHAAITRNPLEYLLQIKYSLQEIAHGAVMHNTPPKQIFSDDDGDFRSMPSVVYRGKSISKIVKIIGTNNVQKIVEDKISVGKAFNIHPIENFITDIFDANILSSARTGVIAVVAAELLATDLDIAMIIGCGNVGYYCAFYLCSIGRVSMMIFNDLNREKVDRFVKHFSQLFPNIVFASGDVGDYDASIIICATNSLEPILRADNTNATTIIGVGADTHYQQELLLSSFHDIKIFVDSYDALRYGDCKASNLNENNVTTIDELIKHKSPLCNRNAFITTGNALLDNLTIEYILNA